MRHKFCRMIAILLAVSILCSGCEPLRKKFVRKKTAAKEQEKEVVLDPVEYAPRSQDPAREYRYLFGLWVVWHKDLLAAIEEDASRKRLTGLCDELLVGMVRMQTLLSGEPAKTLEDFRNQLEGWRQIMAQPETMRDNRQLEANLERLGRDMRRRLKFEVIEKDIVSVSAPAVDEKTPGPESGEM